MSRIPLSTAKVLFILAAIEIAYEMCGLVNITLTDQALIVYAQEVFKSTILVFQIQIKSQEDAQEIPSQQRICSNIIVRCDELLATWKLNQEQNGLEIVIVDQKELLLYTDQKLKSVCKHVWNRFLLQEISNIPNWLIKHNTRILVTCEVRIQDFSNAILCMCLGNGFFKIRFAKNGDLLLSSTSESGRIVVIVQTNIKKLPGCTPNAIFATKFLKNFLTALQHHQKQCFIHFLADSLVIESHTRNRNFVLHLFPQVGKVACQT
jgi:hypothetical protein